ncbi:hypothetical protein lbkm_0726 [Lachnospiraceae bacterium KM106-2]|nr:hypothetical protein lbkm_0726 [Lachnospiraceae bacterium KM106-2]
MILYKIAAKRLRQTDALIISGIYLFNPAIYINSTIWGQVDSIFTLGVVLILYYIVNKKHERAFYVYAIATLIKPQTILFTPILLLACFEEVFVDYDSDKLSSTWIPFAWTFRAQIFKKYIVNAVAAIGVMFALILPFGVSEVVKQFTKTLGSYDRASVNAYNIWTMFGLNWHLQTDKFLGITYRGYGTFFIIVILVVTVIFFFTMKKKKSKYFLLAAFVNVCMFTFSVRMHERYLFPALILILIAFLYKPNKHLLVSFGLLSVAHFYNVAYVYLTYPDHFDWDDKTPNHASVIMVLVVMYFLFIVYRYYFKNKKDNTNYKEVKTTVSKKQKKNNFGITPSSATMKFTKFDWICMLLIIGIYSIFAIRDLGYKEAPETGWEQTKENEAITLDFGKKVNIGEINYYLGNYENRTFDIYTSDDTMSWKKISPADDGTDFNMCSVFKWDTFSIQKQARYIRLVSTKECAVIKELYLTDPDGKHLVPINTRQYKNLFDEQTTFDPAKSFRSGTYFDEIYHARTAYEYIHGLYSYENTHPPLGKIFISLGIRMFGMNPFGWRIMGTLFGIAMLLVIYLFGKKMFRKTSIASVVTILFAADFMHFTQTRIATIDVFVTFFVILMYYFMYCYTKQSFFDTKLSKTFVTLLLCGISMGLGIACKATGVYAAVGLAVIFFWNLSIRYREYRYACQDVKGTTNGISHEYVVKNFASKTWKTIGFCLIAFIVIPFIIYLLSYLPFSDGTDAGLLKRMFDNQVSMFNYHSHLVATHPYSSWWYEWPTMVRPIWYYSNEISSNVAEGISAFGNPLVWWVGIPSFIYMIYLAVKERDRKAIFLIVGYMAQYLPWFFVTRITFIYHYFPSVPFVILMIAYSIVRLVKRFPKVKYGVVVYVAVACILFFMFYPVLSGQPVAKSYVNHFLRWFDSWVLLVK